MFLLECHIDHACHPHKARLLPNKTTGRFSSRSASFSTN